MAAVMDVIKDVAQIVRRAPNGTLIEAYVRAARELCGRSRWYRSTLNGPTVAGQQLYSLGSDPLLEVVGVRAVSGAWLTGAARPWMLQFADPTLWNPNVDQAMPQMYAYIPEAQLAVWPVPDDAYQLTMTLQLQPKTGVTEIPDALLTKWDRVIQAGALAYLLRIPGQPWTDPVQAEAQRRTFEAGVGNAKADEQRAYNFGTTFIRRRPFVVGRM